MNWKEILPESLSVSDLSFEECRNFKQYSEILSRQYSEAAPKGFIVFEQLRHHLLFYALCCIQEKKYPALNRCWEALFDDFGGDAFDSEWMLHLWVCCDFPLQRNSDHVLIDDFREFGLSEMTMTETALNQFQQFCDALKNSRMGFYKEVLSTSKITKFRELFTGQVISTVRSVPNYESGEIFLTRIISLEGDNFLASDPKSYPPDMDNVVTTMIAGKIPKLSNTGDMEIDYSKFMKLAGPYLMSSTHQDPFIDVLSPCEYLKYYEAGIAVNS